MVGEPTATPVTTPVADTVACPELLLLQVPLRDVLARLMEEPAHIVPAPVIEAAGIFTVST